MKASSELLTVSYFGNGHFLVAQTINNCNAGTCGFTLGCGKSPGEEDGHHSRILALRTHGQRLVGYIVHVVAEIWT